ncbi:hypothetical protein ADEAN_000889400 [Angomonas deanei]|uniref:BRCT domain-containing protein n=1 Tax=Angomonas deanei TaxID=59799 RepID=A0A7G2CT16_9TRYP|nr:hypothetical protein ADEAN_000889400 [Angomonas deanei]
MTDGVGSMWLQDSVQVPDPLPDINSIVPVDPNVNTPLKAKKEGLSQRKENSAVAKPMSSPAEMLLMSTPVETSTTFSTRKPSIRYSSYRASVTNNAFFSPQEFDELRAKYNQLKRDLLKQSDFKKDLEMAKYELTKMEEENKMQQKIISGIKEELETTNNRLREERAKRATLEDDTLRKEKENDTTEFLKSQLDQMRADHRAQIEELTRDQESQYQHRMDSINTELTNAVQTASELEEEVRLLTQERNQLVAETEKATERLHRAEAELEKKSTETTSLSTQLTEAEEQYRTALAAKQKQFDEHLGALRHQLEEHHHSVLAAKDALVGELTQERDTLKEKMAQRSEEAALLRHQLEEAKSHAAQLKDSHQKELYRLTEEKRLALSAKEMEIRAALQESKSGEQCMNEENTSLKRQLAKVNDDLSTVSAVLAQRNHAFSQLERDLSTLKSENSRLDQDNIQLSGDNELLQRDLQDAQEVISTLRRQNDDATDEITKDLEAYKAKIHTLESAVREKADELRRTNAAHLTEGEQNRREICALRDALDKVNGDYSKLKKTVSNYEESQNASEEYKRRYASEKKRAEDLETELAALQGRLTALEKQLTEERHRFIGHNLSRSPVTRNLYRSMPSPGQPAARSASSTSKANVSVSLKRARTEDARVIGFSGFTDPSFINALESISGIVIAGNEPNAPLPSNVTHLVTNGQVTLKLLSALVRGCWILPASFAKACKEHGAWLSESEYGFQHEEPPLLHKKIFLTEDFIGHKNHSHMLTLIKEGGAILVDSDPEAADIVMITNADKDKYANGITWAKLLELVYPIKIK